MAEAEAKAWLDARERPDLAEKVSGERTLAELFATLQGFTPEERAGRRIGFQTGA